MTKEDYSELTSFFINKTTAISFLSCTVDFSKIQIPENLEKLRAIQVRGDSELIKVDNLLDKVWGLKRLDYIGVSLLDQLMKYNFKQKLPQLGRVCLSSYFYDMDVLERFLIEILPALDYLELSSVQLTEELINKISEKFKQVVIFGSPDLPHNKRQHMLSHYTITVSVLFAKDFPINIRPQQPEGNTPLHVKGQDLTKGFSSVSKKGSPSIELKNKLGAGAASEKGGTFGSRSMLMEESAARMLASSHDSNPQTRQAASNL
jgi:hypothetical protein